MVFFIRLQLAYPVLYGTTALVMGEVGGHWLAHSWLTLYHESGKSRLAKAPVHP